MSSAETANVDRVEHEHVRRAEDGDQHTRERRADHVGRARDAVEQARRRARASSRPARAGRAASPRAPSGRARRGARPRRRARGAPRAGGRPCGRGSGSRARSTPLARSATMLARRVAEPVDDHPAERGGDDEGKEREEADEAGLADAAGRLEHEPGDRDLGEAVARDRDRIRGEEAREWGTRVTGARRPAGRGGRRKRTARASAGGSGRAAAEVRLDDLLDLPHELDRLRRASGAASCWRGGSRSATPEAGCSPPPRRRASRCSPRSTSSDASSCTAASAAGGDVLRGLEHEARADRPPGPVAPCPAARVLDEPEPREQAQVVGGGRRADPDGGAELGRRPLPVLREPLEDREAVGMGESAQCARIAEEDVAGRHIETSISKDSLQCKCIGGQRTSAVDCAAWRPRFRSPSGRAAPSG